jgi:hypothetical protein
VEIEWNGLLQQRDTAKVGGGGPVAIIKVKPRECRLCAGAGIEQTVGCLE